MQRNRIAYIALLVITIMLGLFSRTEFVPKIVYPYLGDYFYAIMIFVIVGFLFNKTTSLKVAIASILICFGIEILQLYQADWINEIRNHRLGALVLGSGFLWSDLVSYTLGGTTGYVLERLFFRKKWLKSKH